MASRNALVRLQNPAGHKYEWYVDGGCHVCCVCGTAEHRSGRYYYVGRWSKIEPPCDGDHMARQEWLSASNTDEEDFKRVEGDK